MMKRTLLTLCFVSAALLGICPAASAGEYEDLLQKAESANSIQQRLGFLLEASKKTNDEKQKLALYEKGFSLAEKLNVKEYTSVFAELLKSSPVATAEQKASAMYTYLMTLPRGNKFKPGASFKLWEEYLAMPGKDPKDVKTVKFKLLDVYHNHNRWYKEIELAKELLNDPATSPYEKQDLYIRLSDTYLSMNRMKESLDCLEEMLKMPTLAPKRRARCYVRMGDTLLKGYGWYYRPDEAQYKKVAECYLNAMNVKNGGVYGEALVKLVGAANRVGKKDEVLALAKKYLTDNKRADRDSWMKIRLMEANTLQALERFEEALAIFEELYKFQYQLADTCMSLGYNYYRNENYSMALGMYDEALVELGMADDARPAQCKYWINRLKWFSGGKKILDELYYARAKRINAEAIAQGKEPPMKEVAKDPLRPWESRKAKKKEKPPQTLEELNKPKEENLLDEGLDLE